MNQSHLAKEVQISRQALFQIELGNSIPRVDTALRIARALGLDVESLFGPDESDGIMINPEGFVEGTRVDLTRIDGRWTACPSDNPERMGAGFASCDGVLAARASGMAVISGTPAATLTENVFIAGCDPALEMLAQDSTRMVRRGRCIWIPCGNEAALQRLIRGEAQVAGIHFGGDSDAANLAAIRKLGLDKSCLVLRFSSWEQGWMLSPKAKKSCNSLAGFRTKQSIPHRIFSIPSKYMVDFFR